MTAPPDWCEERARALAGDHPFDHAETRAIEALAAALREAEERTRNDTVKQLRAYLNGRTKQHALAIHGDVAGAADAIWEAGRRAGIEEAARRVEWLSVTVPGVGLRLKTLSVELRALAEGKEGGT